MRFFPCIASSTLAIIVRLCPGANNIGLVRGANAFALSRSPSSMTSVSTSRPSVLNFDNHGLQKYRGVRNLSTALNVSGGGEEKAPTLTKELLAEFLGTFLLVHIGCGAVCSAVYTSSLVGLWQVAIVWALAVTLSVACVSSISGAHLNPAVTFALALLRDKGGPKKWIKVIWFSVVQVAGAAAAAFVNYCMYAEKIVNFEQNMGIVRGTAGSIASAKAFGEYWSVASWKSAFFIEAMGTAVLAFVIFCLTNQRNTYTQGTEGASNAGMLVPPLIGGTVAMIIGVIAPLTQSGLNPARDFGPRLVTAWMGWGKTVSFQGCWVYILAPIVGAAFGGWIADYLLFGD